VPELLPAEGEPGVLVACHLRSAAAAATIREDMAQ
jgi:hypothetical protein